MLVDKLRRRKQEFCEQSFRGLERVIPLATAASNQKASLPCHPRLVVSRVQLCASRKLPGHNNLEPK